MKYWVFDLDGTLVDSLTIHFRDMKVIFGTFGVHYDSQTQQEILKLSAKTMPGYFAEKFGPENLEHALRLYEELKLVSVTEVQPFQGIRDLLSSLQKRGVGLALWTARDLEGTEKILKNTGLEHYFSVCVSGSCVEQGKPHPEGLEKIAEHFSSSPEQMVMIGDFDSDMLGARAFGIKSIRVTWHPSVNAEKCPMAHWQFNEVSQLQSLVNQI